MSSKWSEIRNHFITTNTKALTSSMNIDAWCTDNDNEEGRVIAEVRAIHNTPTNDIIIKYVDNKAKTDPYAQEVIQESITIMETYNILQEIQTG